MPTNLITWMKQANSFKGICLDKKTDNPNRLPIKKIKSRKLIIFQTKKHRTQLSLQDNSAKHLRKNITPILHNHLQKIEAEKMFPNLTNASSITTNTKVRQQCYLKTMNKSFT